MEFENEIAELKIKIKNFYHLCLAAKHLKIYSTESYLNLHNAFNNSLQQIISIYQNKNSKDHATLSIKMLTQSIEQSISNLEIDTGKTSDEILALYNKIANLEFKNHILSQLINNNIQMEQYIQYISSIQSELNKNNIDALDKIFIKNFGFKISYSKALENIKELLTNTIRKHINLKKLPEDLSIELSDESFHIILNEAINSFIFDKKHIRHFACIIKFAIEIKQSTNIIEDIKLDTQKASSLLSIILDIKNNIIDIHESLEDLNHNREIKETIRTIETTEAYLNGYINEIERSILLIDDNLYSTTIFLKETAKNYQSLPKLTISQKKLNEILKNISLLSSKIKSFVLLKFDFYEKSGDLEKRMNLKSEGFSCYALFEKCYLYKDDVTSIKNHPPLFNIIIEKIKTELNILDNGNNQSDFENFSGNLLDGYYFLETKKLSSNCHIETAYASLFNFNTEKILQFIVSNIENTPKNNINDYLAFSEQLAILSLTFEPTVNNIEICEKLLSILLSKGYHKYTYKIPLLIQDLRSKEASILDEYCEISNLDDNLQHIATEGMHWPNYFKFIEDFSEEIKQSFHFKFKSLKPSDFKDDAKPLQMIFNSCKAIEKFTIQSILLFNYSPRMQLSEIENLYHFYLDFLEALINKNELNGALSIYSALTSKPITNLAIYLKNPVTEKFKSTFNLDQNSNNPIINLTFQRKNEIDINTQDSSQQFINAGGFLKDFFSAIKDEYKLKYKSSLDTLIEGYNQNNKTLNTEEQLTNISMQINIPLNKLTSIESFQKALSQIYNSDKVLRFNNNENASDLVLYLKELIQKNTLSSFDSSMKTLSLIRLFSTESLLSDSISIILNIYKSQINDIIKQKTISNQDKIKVITFYKAFNENNLLSEMKKQYPTHHPIHTEIKALTEIYNEFDFIENGVKLLNYPHILALEQIAAKTVLTHINTISDAMSYFIENFDINHPVESEKKFNAFISDSLKKELGGSPQQISSIIKFINLPINFFNINDAVKKINDILALKNSLINFNDLESYIQFIDALKTHFQTHSELFEIFSESFSFIIQIEDALKNINNLTKNYSNLLDEDQANYTVNINTILNNIAINIKTLANRYTPNTISELVDELQNKKYEFENHLAQYELFKINIEKQFELYSKIYKQYLCSEDDSDEFKIKISFYFCAYATPESILNIMLSQFIFLTEPEKEKAYYLIRFILTEGLVTIEQYEYKIQLLLETIGESNNVDIFNIQNITNQLIKPIFHISEKNKIHIQDEFNAFLKDEGFHSETIVRDLSNLLSYHFSQSPLITLEQTQPNWQLFLEDANFAFLNFYGSFFSAKIRAKIITLFVALSEQAALEQDINILIFFNELINSPIILNDYAALSLTTTQIKTIKTKDINSTKPNLIESYEKIKSLLNTDVLNDATLNEVGQIYYNLYSFHAESIVLCKNSEIISDINNFINQYNVFLPIHECDPNSTRSEYLQWINQNISPIISKNLKNLKNLNIYMSNSDNLIIIYDDQENKKPEILSEKKAKKKLFQIFEKNYLDHYATINAGDIDQIQELVRKYLSISESFEKCLIRNHINPNPEINALNTFILHPELIELHEWSLKNRQLKKSSTFKIMGKDPEVDALWRIQSIIEKLTIIDKLTKQVNGKLSIETILNLKSMQRKMITLALEIKDTYENKPSTFDNLDVFHWTRKFHKLEDEMHILIGIKKKSIPTNASAKKWGWRQALGMLGIIKNPTLTEQQSKLKFEHKEALPSYLNQESLKQEQLLSNLKSILEGSIEKQNANPFSTQFLIQSFLQSFDWSTDDLRINIPELKRDHTMVNLLGTSQYIPQDLQLEVVFLVMISMDIISKLAGSDGEYAPINNNKIDDLATIIMQANDAINKFFIDSHVPPTKQKISELTIKFKEKKQKLMHFNLQLYHEVTNGLNHDITLNPEVNNFLRHNENIMYQMISDNIFDLKYTTVLSPATEPNQFLDDMEDDPEIEALLNQLLNQESDTEEYTDNNSC